MYLPIKILPVSVIHGCTLYACEHVDQVSAHRVECAVTVYKCVLYAVLCLRVSLDLYL